MDKLIVSSAPHIHGRDTGRGIMLDVIIALLPAAAAAVIIFGLRALGVIAACVIASVLAEFLFNVCTRREQTVGDLSAVVTGLLLGLNLSASVPIWQCVVGSAFAIVIVKCLFGGLGHNFANPAITGRVFMLLAFSSVAGGAMPVVVELEASATPLELIASGSEQLPGLWDMFIGLRGGRRGRDLYRSASGGLHISGWKKGHQVVCSGHLRGYRVPLLPCSHRGLYRGPL